MVLWEVIFWAVLTIALIVAELTTIQLVSVWFAAGSLVSFVLSLLGVPFTWQVVVFIAISIILLFATRPFVKKFMSRGIVKTNADSIVLKECIVIDEVDNSKGTGRVKVDGLDWAARSAHMEKIFEVGDVCTIREIQGVTVIIDQKQA